VSEAAPTAPGAWDPAQYERFREERSQPFFDLLGLVQPRTGMRVVDLGCGTGELTAVLHEQLGAAETVGIDSSPAMLARAAGVQRAGLRFEKGDIGLFAVKSEFDLVFSNAALQWLPGHEALLPRLAAALRAGGQLAVQMPANHDHPSHEVAFALAREEPFRTAMGGYERTWPVLAPERYAELLHRLGFESQDVRLQVYPHLLASREEVVEWVRGTLLTDYQARMPAETFVTFLAAYRERLLPLLQDARPYFYAFKRVLMWGQRPA
jgi:trans-aconitate 2-methyltransferase